MVLSQLGWNEHFAQAFARCSAGLLPGRVTTETRGFYQVWGEDGSRAVQLAGTLKEARPVTGDWVAFDPVVRRIDALLERRTKVSRKRAGRAHEEQVLAANVDVAFLVSGLDQDFNVRRIERYLYVVNEGGASAVIVLNKLDLCDDAPEKMEQVKAMAPNVPIVVTSALEPDSVAQLNAYMTPGQTAVVLGSSGAGKSTITNRLVGGEPQATNIVREHDSRGHHTTRTREMFLLDAGWLLIDTPGVRELEPWVATLAAGDVFADIEELARDCRFTDCAHMSEPGCAVREKIAPERLAGFCRMRDELAEAARRRLQDRAPKRTGRR